MKDIGDDLRRAKMCGNWSKSKAAALASAMASAAGAELDWDGGAGEEWMRVLTQDVLVGFVHVCLPIVLRQHDAVAITIPDDVVAITIQDMDANELKCDLAVLEETFASHSIAGRPWEIDLEGFSAMDLWAETV